MGRRFSWLLLLCMNFLFIAEPAILHAQSARHPRNANVSFELYRDYLIVLQVRVGPLKGLNFLLDTGATPSVLDPHIAAKLHLETVPTEVAVLQGTARGATATIPSLQVGPVLKENLPVLVEDLSFVQKVVPVHLDGIVGLDVLGQSAFVIDYVSHNIRFGSANLASSVPLQLKQGLAMLTATVNHEPAQLLLDTGAPSLILFRRLGQRDQGPGAQVASNSIGDHSDKVLRLDSLTVGSAVIRHPSAYVVANQSDQGHDFAGVLSPAALGFRRVGIDLARGELAFSRDPE